MLKNINKTILVILILFPVITYADFGFSDIFNALTKIYGVNLDIKNLDIKQLNKLNDLTGALKGTHNYGKNYYAGDYGWGSGANDWQSVLSMTHRGNGDGELGNMIGKLSKQFPMSDINSPNKVENQYYQLEAQDALASRSSSEVAYKQAIHAERTMNNLHSLIDKTPDSKSATDLNNRIATENTMNSIEQTKLLSILVQQSSLDEQARANRAKEDKEFFEAK